MKYKEDDVILCTVKNVEGTTVFLDLEEGGMGSMTLSEVAPGRIRNIREFIAPNKKVVCKILRVHGDHVELSLRRVTAKEREFTLDRYKKEKVFVAMLKPVLKDKLESVLEKIKEKNDLVEFFDQLKENISLIEKLVTKDELQQLEKVFAEKKDKEKEVKKTILIKTMNEAGVENIKTILATKNAKIHYLGSSKFSVSVTDKDLKRADTHLEALLKEMKDKAKKMKVEFEVK